MEVSGKSTAVAGFSQFSGVSMQTDVIRARSNKDERGVMQTIPVFTGFGPVTLSKGVVGDNDFIDWLFSASAGLEACAKSDNLYRTLIVVALDDNGKRGVEWTLKDALPISYELAPMNGTSSEVLSETLTFAISGVSRRTNTPAPKLTPPIKMP